VAQVTIERLSKRFGDIQALDDVTLEIADGEFFCVLGPPGAGKTTLLRSIIGLERPEEGRVIVADRDVTDVHPGSRDISIVFQNLALYPDKTVYDNLAFPLRQQKPSVAKSEIDRRVVEAARILRIEPLLKRRPAKLSGGERQRVAIGRCLVRAPLVYLLDEPLSALDALLRLEMRAELKHLQRDLGRTLVYVTHDQVEAMSMSDRLCVLDRGRIQQVDAPEVVYNRPANTFVARTVGTPPMNLVPLEVEEQESSLDLRSPSVHLRAPVGAMPEGLRRSSAVQLGVRPEDVHLGTDGRPAHCELRVVAVEPLGGEVIVDLELDGRILKAMTAPGITVQPDDIVPVSFDLSRVHLFDGEGRAGYTAGGDTVLSGG
jgi:multiple sugar transport system ATP-binding protein